MPPTVVRQTYQQLDVLLRLLAAYPEQFSPTPSSSLALPAFAQGRLISPLGIEGLHQIGNSLATLRSYYVLGVRYATLTHNCHNRYADAALTNTGPNNSIVSSKPLHGGLSEAGVALIKEMNRIGMIVDLSHVSHDTMLDSMGGNTAKFPGGSIAPVIFSHSSSYALCAHPRNVPDSILPLVRATNSLVMVNFNPEFISCTPASPDSTTGIPDFYPANSTLQHVVAHIKHIGDLIGFSHVGLGSDFDGIPGTPRGLEDVSRFPALVAEMLRQGISDDDAGRVVGGNLLRVWRDVEAVAERLQRDGQRPMEDDL
jgi:membrane dipeptidase